MKRPSEWFLEDAIAQASVEEEVCGGTLLSLEKPVVLDGSSEKWLVEISYYKFGKGAFGFTEAYVLSSKNDFVVGRLEDGTLEVCVMGREASRHLLEDSKPRATAIVEGSAYALGDFQVCVGSLRRASTRAALLSVRYRPLRPSHPAATDAEMKLVRELLETGTKYTRHLPLKNVKQTSFDQFYDIDHHLSLVNCFRTVLYGNGDSTTSSLS